MQFIEVIRAAAHDVERPIFYAIAVIIAGYLPIYVLTGPSGRLFQPMADTMSFALLGALLCALTLLPVLCSFFLRKHVHEPRSAVLRSDSRPVYGRMLGWCLRNRLITVAVILAIFGGLAAADSRASAANSCRTWTKARCGCAPPRLTPFPSKRLPSSRRRSAIFCRSFPQVTTVANELGRPDDGTDPTGFFNNEFYVGLKPYGDKAWQGGIHTKPELTKRSNKSWRRFRASSSITRSPPRMRWTRPRRA